MEIFCLRTQPGFGLGPDRNRMSRGLYVSATCVSDPRFVNFAADSERHPHFSGMGFITAKLSRSTGEA
jgi:hypothetical protein